MSATTPSAGPPEPRKFGRVHWLGIASLVRREMHRELRFFGIAVLGPALQAALFATVFALAAGESLNRAAGSMPYLEFLAPGLVLSALMTRAFESTAYTLMFDKLEAAIEDLLGAPMTAAETLAGLVLAAGIVSIAVAFTVWLVMLLFGGGLPAHPGALLLFALSSAVLFSSTGLIASILSEKWDTLSGKETFILIPIIFLSGTFFPIAAVPEGIWRTILGANPIYWIVDGFRWAMTGQAETNPPAAICIAVGLAALAAVGAQRLLHSGYKLKP